MSNEVTTLQGRNLAANPFGSSDGGNNLPAPSGGNAMMTAEMQRQVAEIQAQFMMALHRPRQPQIAVDRMLLECQRPQLAKVAIYSFSRGGTAITGLSIRALEMVARNWGNIKYGFRCLERRKGVSLLQAYAYDLESNVPVERVFEVRHVRDTKQGPKPITDERDIYELEANQAQRRVRACLEALVPGDVLDACEDAFKVTLTRTEDITPEGIKKMVDAFKSFGVNQKMIEARIQRNMDSITAAQMVGLRSVYNSLKDRMSSIDQWFDKNLADSANAENSSDSPASLKDKIKASTSKDKSEDTDKAQADEPKQGKADDYEGEAKGIAALLDAATSPDAIDEIWNENLDKLEYIKANAPKIYSDLDKQYLSNRDALVKTPDNSKAYDKPESEKLV